MIRTLAALFLLLPTLAACTARMPSPTTPYLLTLGTAQDAGSPQINSPAGHPARLDPSKRRYATCVGLVDPRTGERYLFDATPDMREQAWLLSRAHPAAAGPIRIDGVFITHAHIGHYTGLMFVGRESMGTRSLPVYAIPEMADFLRTNGPWSQLVDIINIEIRPLANGLAVQLADDITVTPILVPHRNEYAEVVAFKIEGPARSALYLPDIDTWRELELEPFGTSLEQLINGVDIAYLDATFFDDNELPGRDMSTILHPRITETVDRLKHLPAEKKANIFFIHLNHTNRAQWQGTPERDYVESNGFRVGARGDIVPL